MKWFQRSGRWWVDARDVGLGRRPLVPPGQKLGTTDEKVALQLFTDLQREVTRRQIAGLPVGRTDPITFARKHVLADPGSRSSASHLRNLESDYVKLFGSQALGALGLEEIRRVHVEAYVTERLKATPRPAPATLRREIMALSRLFSRAMELEKVAANPCYKIAAKVVPELPEPEPHPITLLQARTLLAVADGMTWRNPAFVPLVATILYTGARVGEALLLKVRDIRWDTDTLSLPTLKQRRKQPPKRELRLWPGHAERLRAFLAGRTEGFVFEWRGRRLTQVRRSWEALVAELKKQRVCGDLDLQDLRDTYASLRLSMVERTARGDLVPVPLARVSLELGHKSVTVTERHYARIHKEIVGETLDLRTAAP